MSDPTNGGDDSTPGGVAERPAEPERPCLEDGAWKTTRREFIAYTTAGVVAVALPPGGAEAEGRAAPARPRGPGPVEISLKVNGVRRRLELPPSATLAHALRDELGLTGTKVSCDRGACSACTVLLDGTPVSACMTFALDADGREVTTIEGLSRGGALHPVQEAFIARDAMQCGFCTPGMVMSCAALLARSPHPSLDEVKAATSGNFCRCGAYREVFEAVLSASGAALSKRE